MKAAFLFLLFTAISLSAQSKLLIYMDLKQTDHLKAYGVAYNAIQGGIRTDWLLNYRGGAFLIDYDEALALSCRAKNVSFETLGASEASDLYRLVSSPSQNTDAVRLEKAPRVAVFVTPEEKPWDDAVTLALDYAEIPYDKLWIPDIMKGALDKYDWLHLHHEDFTGQYGKFYSGFSGTEWYRKETSLYENQARSLGFKKVSEMEKSVARAIKNYLGRGGFLFAMCAATDTYDIALASENTDILDRIYDGDPPDQDCQKKLDYSNCLAFENFKLEMNPYVYEYSDIDIGPDEIGPEENDYFTLFEFSAKYDPVPSMLTQCHTNAIKGFMGQTTMFRKNLIKKNVCILAERQGTDQVKYIHGNYGKGTFTFYGGHDPEDYKHRVGALPTDMKLCKNSAGYRLILNNLLFPAARKKEQKT